MIKGISLAETKEFISSFDKGETKTTWKIGALDSDIFDLVDNRIGTQPHGFADAVRFGLKGFDNFYDENDKPVIFSTKKIVIGLTDYTVVSDNIMKIIPPQVKYELAIQIINMSKLSEEERKN